MFRWYKNADVCFAYLSDVSSNDGRSAFRESRWFTRGWTLQELIAPVFVLFFTEDGTFLGNKQALQNDLHEITGIARSAFQSTNLSEFDVDERMSWTLG
ncbi:hypothetical protein C7974DRAFT_403098 [Boeremia exigua]|uniref:uncharacterized protein n=1 Tax=Boeremia exigua TaxID=749465 RepID=UPI001E8D17DC|nr:uncharacterized protein C7974DRAFT_403098 [Boeremia exigua]KAH6615020.1 hypothetical protein C7974DRAFT_403098 [Boeremia exigua]